DQFRDAAGALLQYGNIGRDSFEKILITAQGVSRVLGRGFRESLEKVAKAMQNPVKSFDELREIGVKFNIETQKQISILQAQGKTQEAQAVILEELSGFYKAATEEGKGMTGAMSALSSAFQKLTESIFGGTDAYKSIVEQSYEFAAALDRFTESSRFEAFKELANVLLSTFGDAISFAKNNIEALAGLLGVTFAYTIGKALQAILLYTGTIVKSLIPGLKVAKAEQAATVVSTNLMTAAAAKATAGMKALRFAVASVPLLALVAGAYSVYEFFNKLDKKEK